LEDDFEFVIFSVQPTEGLECVINVQYSHVRKNLEGGIRIYGVYWSIFVADVAMTISLFPPK
jgi:hypothetical protein